MLEWLKRHAWKACIRQKCIAGSNPALSGTAGIPITVKGTITGNDIKLNITIPFMSMNIAVQFSGTKK